MKTPFVTKRYLLYQNYQKMFHSISWKEYTTFIIIATSFYYVVIILIFYRSLVTSLIKRFATTSSSFDVSSRQEEETSLPSEYSEQPDEKTMLKAIERQIREQLVRAKSLKSVKEEVVTALELLLKPYVTVVQPDAKHQINNYIRALAKNICSIHLEEEEVDRLWFR